jgi:hypothetical protein
MLKALERNPEHRYQDAGRMGYDLEYFMYHKGYGPTIVTLEKYMRKLFPNLYIATTSKKEEISSNHTGPTAVIKPQN